MRIGVIILPEDPWAQAKAMWMSLEERGFAHAWIYDHLAWRTLADGPWYATMPTLAAAALVTERIQLGTWVTSPNFRHPVTLAKDLLTLDDMSGGRVLAGMGAGGVGWDSAVFGGPDLSPRQRVDRFAEFVELTDLLLRQPDTSYDGEWFTAVRARMVPAGSRSGFRCWSLRTARGACGSPPAATAGSPRAPGPADTWDDWWTGVAGLVSRFEQVVSEEPVTRGRPDGCCPPMPARRLRWSRWMHSPKLPAGPPNSASPTWWCTGHGPTARTRATNACWTPSPTCSPTGTTRRPESAQPWMPG